MDVKRTSRQLASAGEVDVKYPTVSFVKRRRAIASTINKLQIPAMSYRRALHQRHNHPQPMLLTVALCCIWKKKNKKLCTNWWGKGEFLNCAPQFYTTAFLLWWMYWTKQREIIWSEIIYWSLIFTLNRSMIAFISISNVVRQINFHAVHVIIYLFIL